MSDNELKKTYAVIANPLNGRLISELKNKGENVLVFPAVKTEKINLTADVIESIKNIDQFDWLVITDVYAADYFIETLRELAVDFFELDNLNLCALGEAVSDRLRYVQVHSDVIPSNLSAESIFSAISSYAGGNLENLRFLIIGDSAASSSFPEILKNNQASVLNLPVYRKLDFAETVDVKIITLLKGGAVDEFIFSSAEDIIGLKNLFPNDDLFEMLKEIQIAAATESAFQVLRENGFRPLYFHHK